MTAPEETPVAYALGVNVTVTAGKLAVGLATGSAAMLAETAHSAVDCTTQALLWAGQRHERTRPGVRYRWALAAAAVMFGSGGVYGIASGLASLLGDHPGVDDAASPWWNVAVLVAASSLEATSLVRAVRSLAAKRAVGWLRHLRTTPDTDAKTIVVEDGADILGNVLALVGVVLTAVTGWHAFDAVAAVAVGVLLSLVAVELAGHNVRLMRAVAL